MRRFKLCLKRLQRFFAARDDDKITAFSGMITGEFRADAGRSAGDEGRV
jgi:hypothetical protein